MKLLKMDLLGIKSIDKTISIDFSNKIIDYGFEDKPFIKGIYGPNGAGKTGIITALALYKSIVIYKNAINEPIIKNALINLINKKTKKFEITVYFAKTNKIAKDVERYKHSLTISLINNEPIITDEKYYRLGARMEDHIVLESKDGIIDNKYGYKFKNECTNLLDKSTISSILIDLFRRKGNFENIPVEEDELCVLKTLILASNILVCFGNKEDSLQNIIISNKNSKDEMIINDLITKMYEGKDFYFCTKDFEFCVDKKNKNKFMEYINKMCNFIKVVKNNLEKIDIIDKGEDSEYYHYRLNFVYDVYTSDLQYESTGIKKLANIYETLAHAARGGIGFIDEIDAGVHDVVINKLIEYFCNETKAQLVFTTHNVYLMEYLTSRDHSIDFLSADSYLTKWVKDGTLTPWTTYFKGNIRHIPFNIDSLDFAGKF